MHEQAAYPLRLVLNTLEFDYDCKIDSSWAGGIVTAQLGRLAVGVLSEPRPGLGVPFRILNRAVTEGLHLDWDEFLTKLEKRRETRFGETRPSG